MSIPTAWLVLAAAFGFAYAPTLAGLWDAWISGGDESFALVIPFVSAYLVWDKRHRLARARVEPNYAALPALVLWTAISLYGILGSSPTAVRTMLPLVLLTGTLFCFGGAYFRLLALPLALTVFMLPLPTALEVHLGLPLRSLSTQFGVLLLRMLEVSVFVEGNIIDLGSTRLQVVEACSGLRYLLPLLALGVLFAYFFVDGILKRGLLVLAVFPIAVAANGLRIAVTGVLAQNYGPEAADGFFHSFSGWLLFVFALLLLLAAMGVLRSLPIGKSGGRPSSSGRVSTAGGAAKRISWAAVWISAGLLSALGLLGHWTSGLPPIRLQNGFADFPLQVGDWTGRTESLAPQIVALSGAEEALNAAFLSPQGRSVSLYIGYRGSPFLESENFFHSPDVCMPSMGWETTAASTRPIDAIPGFGSIAVRSMWIEKMEQKQLVYYWFQTRRRVSADVDENRLHLFLHALGRDNTYDLFVRPMTPLFPGESPEDAEMRLDRFVRSLSVVLQQYLDIHAVADDSKPAQNR